jgi:hypothetical protein
MAIAQAVGLRAKHLQDGLKMLLSDSTLQQFYAHPLITTLGKQPAEGRLANALQRFKPRAGSNLHPSYVPSRAFALALLDIVAPSGQRIVDPTDPTKTIPAPVQGFDAVRNSIEKLADQDLRKALLVCFDAANYDLEQARKNVEQWFDSAMDRVTGWYKRHVKKILLVVGAVVTLALNVDTFEIANSLWTSPKLRADLVAAAGGVSQSIRGLQKTSAAACAGNPEAEECVKATAALRKAFTPELTDSVAELEKISDLGIPIGWRVCRIESPSPQPPASKSVDAAPDLPARISPIQLASMVSHTQAAANKAQTPAVSSTMPVCPGDVGFRVYKMQWAEPWYDSTLTTTHRIYGTGNGHWLVNIAGMLFTMIALSFGAPFWFDLINKLLDLRGTGPKPAK